MIRGPWWKAHKEAFAFGVAGFGLTSAFLIFDLLGR